MGKPGRRGSERVSRTRTAEKCDVTEQANTGDSKSRRTHRPADQPSKAPPTGGAAAARVSFREIKGPTEWKETLAVAVLQAPDAWAEHRVRMRARSTALECLAGEAVARQRQRWRWGREGRDCASESLGAAAEQGIEDWACAGRGAAPIMRVYCCGVEQSGSSSGS